MYTNAGGKWQIQCQPLLVQYKQQANPFFISAKLYSTCDQREWKKKAANIIKPRQTRIYRKKYVNGSVKRREIEKNKIKKGATLIQVQIYPFMPSTAQSRSRGSPFKHNFKTVGSPKK